ncbi:hypothetical protein GCM10020001_094730 [Nonomuraea salmonea]
MGGAGVEEVACHEHRVDVLAAGQPDEVAQDGAVLVHAVAALEYLADVPVGGVQDLHALA